MSQIGGKICVLTSYGLQDGFEMVYGKGKGPRAQAPPAEAPAALAAPAAEASSSRPSTQPPPQVRSSA